MRTGMRQLVRRQYRSLEQDEVFINTIHFLHNVKKFLLGTFSVLLAGSRRTVLGFLAIIMLLRLRRRAMMSFAAVRILRRRLSSQGSPGSSQTDTGGADSRSHDFCKSVHTLSLYQTHSSQSAGNSFPSSGKCRSRGHSQKYNEISRQYLMKNGRKLLQV